MNFDQKGSAHYTRYNHMCLNRLSVKKSEISSGTKPPQSFILGLFYNYILKCFLILKIGKESHSIYSINRNVTQNFCFPCLQMNSVNRVAKIFQNAYGDLQYSEHVNRRPKHTRKTNTSTVANVFVDRA